MSEEGVRRGVRREGMARKWDKVRREGGRGQWRSRMLSNSEIEVRRGGRGVNGKRGRGKWGRRSNRGRRQDRSVFIDKCRINKEDDQEGY